MMRQDHERREPPTIAPHLPALAVPRPLPALVASLAAALATLAALVAPTPALAAVPSPSVSVQEVRATSATFYGTLSPGELGATYEFNYGKAGAPCSSEKHAPAGSEEGVSMGEEALPGETVTGLSPGTEYEVCLHVWNAERTEETESFPAERFTTAITPETPTGLEAKPVGSTTATLNGVLNPNAARESEPGSAEFRYRQSPTECEGGENEKSASVAEPLAGRQEEAVAAPLTELLPHTTYSFCLLARNTAGEESTLAGPVSFTTQVAPPSISEAGTTNVASESATLHATVNPDGLETTYAFQYAPAGSTEFKPVLDPEGRGAGTLPEGTSGVPLEVHLQEGLSASTTYEFRLVATHAGKEEATSEPVWFRTQNPSGSFALLDGRAWEMVSPPDKHGAAISPNFIGTGEMTQAAAAGGAITYLADAPTEARPAGYTVTLQVMSKRGPQGWESRDIAPPHATATGGAVASGYVAFDEGLSSSLLQPEGAFEPALSPQATEQTPFMRDNETGAYAPLVTKANDTAKPFSPFGEEGKCPPLTTPCGPLFVGAAPDLKHPVVRSRVALTETPLPAESPLGLYEWSEGKLSLVSALPDGEAAGHNPVLGAGHYSGNLARNAISQDGSRVVWSEKGGELHLFMRYNATQPPSPVGNEGKCSVPTGACTLQLDVAEPGTPPPSEDNPVGPVFQTASADGSRVFFTDTQRLTANAGAGHFEEKTHDDLYVCEMTTSAGGEQTCNLTDLTPKHNGESAGVQEVMPGISGEGCDVGSGGECNAYFVADGVLSEEPNAAGEHAVHGDCEQQVALLGALCNLYVAHWDGSGWTTRLVAVLSMEDAPDWVGEGSLYAPEEMTSRVSPNGRYLEFMSQRDLTGYDPIDAPLRASPTRRCTSTTRGAAASPARRVTRRARDRRESNSGRCGRSWTAPRACGVLRIVVWLRVCLVGPRSPRRDRPIISRAT